MKRFFMLILFGLICGILFAQKWEIEEKTSSNNNLIYFYYEITNTPEEYKEFIGQTVFYYLDKNTDMINNGFLKSKKDVIINLLNTNKFVVNQKGDEKYIFLPEIPVDMETKITKEQLTYMWQMFEEKYAGFSELKEKGLTKRKFLRIKTYNDMQKFMDKYVNDCHMAIYINDYCFRKPTSHDEGCVRSLDSSDTYFEKETSNAYYVRVCNCVDETYHNKFPLILYKAIDKEYLILDGRSNSGGDDTPQWGLQNNLANLGFKGTVVVLQDNYSFSSGEIWEIFAQPGIPYKCILVGTHSGGMQRFGNNWPYQNEEQNVLMYLCETDFNSILPDNYLGEGKGYEPNVWATTPQMKETLEGMGIDTGDIIFQ